VHARTPDPAEGRPRHRPQQTVGAVGARAGPTLPADPLPHDSGGQVRPRYRLAWRPAGLLAWGELAIEPILGPVRVAAVSPPPSDGDGPAAVRVTWSDDTGPCHATATYPAQRRFAVRVPHPHDILLVRRDLNQARSWGGDIAGQVARLIAAHLHSGPRSGLYRFAVDGAVTDALYDELDRLAAARPAYRRWVSALARYCVGRCNPAPVPGWGPPPPATRWDRAPACHDEPTGPPARDAAADGRCTGQPAVGDTALRLMDAAFALGVAAARGRLARPTTRRPRTDPA
jgi:hypothetical protein